MALLAACAGGCSARSGDTHVEGPYPRIHVVGIAPLINQSGSRDIDPLAASDLFFQEAQMVRGFQVLPINRSLQAMAGLKMAAVTSPDDVLRLGQAMGAELMFVGVITAYNPYNPPEVGLAVQLYVVPGPSGPPAGLGDIADSAVAAGRRPVAQIAEVYSARHENVQKAIRQYAEIRGRRDSALGWQLYTKSAPDFVRFCCHRAIVQVLQLEQGRLWTEPVTPGP